LSRTPASATNRTTWTWSGWVKRGTLGSLQSIFGAGAYSNGTFLYFTSTDVLYFEYYDGVSVNPRIQSVAVYRDPAAWYHIVIAWDSSNATANDRMRLYVNGSRVTSLGVNVTPTQNLASTINNNIAHYIGQLNGQYPFDGYLTEINFIDGQALTPSSFGSTNALTGVWQPARYTGTYGTNGFYLPFTDNSALTTSSNVGLGKDFSGNGNYWTTNNISITAGVTYDSMTDVPTLTSATAANFAVLNPVSFYYNSTTVANGNLQMTGNAAANHSTSPSTIAVSSGKWYAEFTLTVIGGNYAQVGILSTDSNLNTINPYIGGFAKGYAYWKDGSKANNTVNAAYGTAYTTSDVIGVAFDADAGTLVFYKNNTSQGTAYSGITGTFYFAVDAYNTGAWVANFGQRPFTYTPPTGFVALNTYNLPTSTIVKGNTVMDATLYTGTGASLAVTNAAGFQPDLVWIKVRSNAISHALTDSVRGISSILSSDLTSAQATQSAGQGLTAFNSNGFSLGTQCAGSGDTNFSGRTYVGWQWQAGQGSSSSNTNGTITSTVSVNASAGFSVVTWTGTGANATVGHGLGVAPQFIIVKNRSSVTAWPVYTSYYGKDAVLQLESTSGGIAAANYWGTANPTSSVFGVGTASQLNGSGNSLVAYCWTPIAGFSAFGSYTGNGSADGVFVYFGFKPRFVLIKRTDGADSWCIWDTARNTYNAVDELLLPNSSSAAITPYPIDVLSNGMKARGTNTAYNASGGTYIYAAFASNPFRNSLAQ
jgi:hypothetical protein